MEDIPAGVVGVLTRSLTDVLSHVAIRARCTRALLATCYDAEAWGALSSFGGSYVSLSIAADGAVICAQAATPAAGAGSNGASAAGGVLQLGEVSPAGEGSPWALAEGSFEGDRVGKKSLNLKLLRERAGASGAAVAVPACVALPFGTFERVLAANPATADRLKLALAGMDGSSAMPAMDQVTAQLAEARGLVSTGLTAPAGLMEEVRVRDAGRCTLL